MSLLDRAVIVGIHSLGFVASAWVGWATGIGWVPAVCIYTVAQGVLQWRNSRPKP